MSGIIDFTDERVFRNLPKGVYTYVANVAIGPIVMLVSDDGGANFVAIPGASFAADDTAEIGIAEDFVYKATMGAGDTLRLSLKESGKA
jgi:hypothetical protein